MIGKSQTLVWLICIERPSLSNWITNLWSQISLKYSTKCCFVSKFTCLSPQIMLCVFHMISMYLTCIYFNIEIKYHILIQCHGLMGIVMRLKTFNYMLKIGILILSDCSQKMGVLWWFLRVWASKWWPDALHAKAMITSLDITDITHTSCLRVG